MRILLSRIFNVLTNEAVVEYEWRDLLIKSTVFVFAVYMLVVIDTMIYSYFTA